MIGVGTRDPGTAERGVVPQRPVSWHALDLRGLDGPAERAAWVALSLVPGMGPAGFAAVLHRFGSAQAALRAGVELVPYIHRAPAAAAEHLRQHAGQDPAGVLRRAEAAMARVGGRVITAVDDAYPGILCHLDPRPPVLYVSGNQAALEGTAVAVVGTRRASGYGRSTAIDIADALARAGMVVVSGLALGIDGEAHRAAIDADGTSVAVLPSPLDRVYPPRHADLARRIVATGGALVSEVPPGVAIGRPDFARRNRLIVGLSSAVVVVEAPDRSGALLTAALAISLGRELYAVPGPIDAVASRGCNRLIADQSASIVTSSGALLQRLGAFAPGRRGTLPALSDVEGLVLGQLLRRSASIEELMGRLGMPAAALASALTFLEARGLATSYGGATFHPTLLARGRGTRGAEQRGP
ncbi:MAG: DNA-processing protein DprA [Chloroflexota bacterium]